ncbi:hypothetical protein [Rhizobium sp. 18055]|uniref:hypothetical protein n=1 Tax=Rhizobium sp. 18055 TaxID=2681403 RepID=UPI00135B16E4|nr:hypothetical protein [Rhizobium sp. 18055]
MLAVSGKEAFDETKAELMDGMYHTAENMVYEAIESLARSSSSSALRKGQKMQRYFRDILTLTSRGDFFEFRAANLAQNYLVKEGYVAAPAAAAT